MWSVRHVMNAESDGHEEYGGEFASECGGQKKCGMELILIQLQVGARQNAKAEALLTS